MSQVDQLFIVDDDEVFTMLFSLSIKHNKSINSTKVFVNGKLAIEYIEQHSGIKEKLPDVIFLDLNMPIMDGWQFLERYETIVDQLAKPIDIYVLSSSIFPEDVNKAKSFKSVKEYLIKPIAHDKLIEIISSKNS